MNHPPQQELFEYTDGALDGARAADIASHLAVCAGCRDARGAILMVEGAVRLLPPELPSRAFTRKLLNRIGLKESTPLWWLFLRNFAPILAAGIVAAVIITLGSAASGGTEPSVRKSLFDAGPVMETVRGAVDGFSAWTARVAAEYLSFTLGKDAFSLTMFLCFLFGGIGLLDRFLFGPLLRRRND